MACPGAGPAIHLGRLVGQEGALPRAVHPAPTDFRHLGCVLPAANGMGAPLADMPILDLGSWILDVGYTVAERIATERGEQVGQSVGYQIRLESKGGPHCSLMMSTTGVLLRRLVAMGEDAALDATHIIVDEVHERDRYADFLLIILR